MAKRRKIEAITTGELELPEPIIQHIQSFLSAKRAAQTTLLSKSWREAWLTRPNLDFDQRHFHGRLTNVRTREPCFWVFVKETFQRYEKSNLKIESLRLYIEDSLYQLGAVGGCDFVNQLILRSLKLGATRIDFRIYDNEFVLSPDVFGAEKLVGLSVEGCTIDLDPRVIRCSGLKSLRFRAVRIKRFDRIPNIISRSFPLIEKLSLSNVYESTEYVSDRRYPLNLHKLNNLRSLVISFVKEIDPLFLGDLSSKFPSLKDFSFLLGDIEENMLISSRSLERFCFGLSTWHRGAHHKKKRVTFDFPSLRVFKFEGSVFPSFSFKSTPSRECESRLSITRRYGLSTSWFLKLNEFLLEFIPSKIHFSLHVHSNTGFNYEVEDIEGLRKPVLENLTMDTDGLTSLIRNALYDALFRLCRPKIITQYVPRKSSFRDDFLCKTLVLGMDGKCSHCMRGLHDLKKVFVQVFDKDVAVWRDLPWKDFLNASASQECKQKMCFHLRWKL